MDPAKILFWNVRGLNSSLKQDAVRNLVDSFHVDVVCCQETKMQQITRTNILSTLGVDFHTLSSCLRWVLVEEFWLLGKGMLVTQG
jgi:hypothetical protein